MAKKYVFLVRGKKGLYYTDGVHLYLPNNRQYGFEELTEGVYEVLSTFELPKCTLINVKKVKTDSFTEEIISDVFSKDFMNYRVKEGIEYVYYDSKLYVVINGKVVLLSESRYEDNKFSCQFFRDLYINSETKQIEVHKRLTDDEVEKFAIRHYTQWVQSIKIYNNEYAIIDYGVGLIRAYKMSIGELYFSEIKGKPEKIYEPSYLKKKFDEYFLCSTTYRNDPLVEYRCTVFNEHVSFKRVNCNLLRKELDDTFFKYVEEARKSMEEFEATKKRLGKYVTKNNMAEFRKLAELQSSIYK